MCTCMSNKSKTCWSNGPHSDVCKQVGKQGLQITKFRLPGKLPKRDIVKCSTHLLSLPFWWQLIEERKKSNKIILKYKVNLASYFNSVENYPAGPLNQVFIAQIWALWVCESLTVHQIFIIMIIIPCEAVWILVISILRFSSVKKKKLDLNEWWIIAGKKS